MHRLREGLPGDQNFFCGVDRGGISERGSCRICNAVGTGGRINLKEGIGETVKNRFRTYSFFFKEIRTFFKVTCFLFLSSTDNLELDHGGAQGPEEPHPDGKDALHASCAC